MLINSDQRARKLIAHWKQPPSTLLGLLNGSEPVVPISEIGNTDRKLFLQAELAEDPDKIIKLANNLKLIKLPRGSFQMGSNDADDEKPIHTVSIDYDFWMSQTEITFDQYDAYVADMKRQANSPKQAKIVVPEAPGDEGWGRGNRPVINVSWNDAQSYLRWLTQTNKEGMQCRLPSEAEWEYAARAGTVTKYPWGNEASHEQANYGKDECCEGLAEGVDKWVNTSPVGSFPANQFGLHDMHGNVDEWVQDTFQSSYEGAPSNGEAWVKGDDSRVLRGSSWLSSPYLLRSAYRVAYTPGFRGYDTGFRVVCSPPSVR